MNTLIRDDLVLEFSTEKDKSQFIRSEFLFIYPHLKVLWTSFTKEKIKSAKGLLKAARKEHINNFDLFKFEARSLEP